MSAPFKLGKLNRKRSDGSSYWSYCVIWWTSEGRVRKTLDTQDKPTAEAKARKLYADRDKGQAEAVDTVGQCIEAYLDSLGGLRDEKRKREGWAAAKAFWAAIPIASVDDALSHSYMAWRQRAINTMRNELSLIRTALNWMHGKAAPKILVPGIPPSKVGHLTKPQFKKFLTGCSMPHVRLFAILGVTTGARKGALLEAKWDQVSWDRQQLDLNPVGRVQNRKQRALVPLNGLAMDALREARAGSTCDNIIEYRGGPIGDIKKGIGAAVVRTGVKVHPHMFRHSAAVWMAEARVPMAEIASFLGHADINITTRIYARFHPDHLREASGALTW
jgi:integrase